MQCAKTRLFSIIIFLLENFLYQIISKWIFGKCQIARRAWFWHVASNIDKYFLVNTSNVVKSFRWMVFERICLVPETLI